MNNRNRRQFLEDSMFAAAAAVASTSTPAILTGQDDNQSSSANEKLGVAVIGVRGRGGSHIGAFAGRRDTEIVTICDADREIGEKRAKEVAKRQGREPKFVEDLRAVMDDPSVDIVSIATPNHWHALSAIWAIQAGKDVYLEKPVSHNVWEGRKIVEAARKYGRICQTGTQSRSNPGMIDAMTFVQAGGVGDIKVARGLCYKRRGSIGAAGNYEPPKSVNYDLWLGPAAKAPLTRPQFHYDWHWQWSYGNGDLGNQGIHQMDLARWGLNKNTFPNQVISYGGRFGYEDAGETANTQVVVHDYGDQALVFEVRGLPTSDYKGSKIGVIFEGTDGYVVMHSYEAGSAFDLDGNKVEDFRGGGNHFENFLTAVRSRNVSDLNADIEEGHLSSALCHLGNISYLLGDQVPAGEAMDHLARVDSTENVKATLARTLDHLRDNKVNVNEVGLGMGPLLTLNPKTESFVDNERAEALLSREYRAPFVVPKTV